ncbi:cytidylyltransferase domain-containing protein [Hymenobacter cheonanensis]|uniref:cytidylyltransferase domain-containing protein n=1 Tax=Hymenobacter sp. CA2-7 TaxID=3063993 RepID=UPI00271222A1|nr:NTP transferase domain-containing protein [Hymenobacter sp. CA2-7]MDO7886992.1 NTP transferase domain-containing protein [Hymenobacter sp. CA2-7]
MALALIQARLGSSRLPGKSRLPLPLAATGDALTVLGHVVRRAQRAAAVTEVVVATTTAPLDDELAALATRLGVGVFRGSEPDVLGRFAGALAAASPAATVVRLTADNPAIDPALLDAAVAHHLATGADYTHTTGLPLGTNLEILSAAALRRAHAAASQPDEREHVTPYLRRHPELFRLETLALAVPPAVAALRLTVDYPSDYALLSLLFTELGPGFSLTDPTGLPVLLARYPWLAAINAGNVQR